MAIDDVGVALDPALFESVQVPLQADEIPMSLKEKFELVSALAARFICLAVDEMHTRGLSPVPDHRVHWWGVLEKYAESEEARSLAAKAPGTKAEMKKIALTLGVEGEGIARAGPEIVRMLTGKTVPLALALRGDLLFRMYRGDDSLRTNRYVADYAKILTSRNRGLRILEVGAGTGATTFQVLTQCSPSGEPFCAEYMYTDVSPAFFRACQTTLSKWENLLTCKVLDLEEDIVEQGFEAHGYDLIITTNCVHTTRSLDKSLRNIRRLLKPGGVLSLVELIKLTPVHNMFFGSLPGWWAGVDEGRTESPLQSPQQWAEHLKKASFSGVDLAAYDLPEPERHSALLLSTAC